MSSQAAYSVAAVTATTAEAGEPYAALWNPSSSISLHVTWLSWFGLSTSGSQLQIARISTRGTPGSTITPGSDNSWDRTAAPPSGALLDLANYTAAATVDAVLMQTNTSPRNGAGMVLFLAKGITVPPGTGLAMICPAAMTTGGYEVAFGWRE
jgi:hypothetical protein